MIYWAPLLHFYQPPTQSAAVLHRICDECYRPLIRVFQQAEAAQATFNVSGSLTELLREHAGSDVISGIRELAQEGKVELTGTAMYHPILPLIPPDERRRQIVLNQQVNRRAFGEDFRPTGFFPPELGFSPAIVPSIVETGHRWLIVSGVATPGDWPLDTISQVDSESGEAAVFFRDDVLSNGIAFHRLSPGEFLGQLRELRGDRDDVYVVTALDAETFGHHLAGWEEEFLAQIFHEISRATSEPGDRDRVQVVRVGDLLDLFPRGSTVEPKVSSWSTSGEDLRAGNPFPLWNDPGNQIHTLQWEVTRLAADLVGKAAAVADDDTSRHFARIARSQLDRALHSCQFWWASRRPMWEVNMVYRGLFQLQEALLNGARAIRSSGVAESERREATYHFVAARELCNRIVDALLE